MWLGRCSGDSYVTDRRARWMLKLNTWERRTATRLIQGVRVATAFTNRQSVKGRYSVLHAQLHHLTKFIEPIKRFLMLYSFLFSDQAKADPIDPLTFPYVIPMAASAKHFIPTREPSRLQASIMSPAPATCEAHYDQYRRPEANQPKSTPGYYAITGVCRIHDGESSAGDFSLMTKGMIVWIPCCELDGLRW